VTICALWVGAHRQHITAGLRQATSNNSV